MLRRGRCERGCGAAGSPRPPGSAGRSGQEAHDHRCRSEGAQWLLDARCPGHSGPGSPCDPPPGHRAGGQGCRRGCAAGTQLPLRPAHALPRLTRPGGQLRKRKAAGHRSRRQRHVEDLTRARTSRPQSSEGPEERQVMAYLPTALLRRRLPPSRAFARVLHQPRRRSTPCMPQITLLLTTRSSCWPSPWSVWVRCRGEADML
jgi:hypothetical protein